jgi:glyoxylase-like metal-dependent hydrolase (beta-lactamase superfamily II)
MSVLTKISEHVYWMPPGPPDRPSVCGAVGDRRALMLDAGSSRAHTRAFLDALWAESAARPSAVVYTHSHWDHVFGGAELGGQVIAQALTAQRQIELAARDWSDEGLDRRVADGLASPQHAANVKEELPSPRTVEVAPADIVFQDGLDIELGGVTVRVRHVGGNHSADSSVMYVEPDRVRAGFPIGPSREGPPLFRREPELSPPRGVGLLLDALQVLGSHSLDHLSQVGDGPHRRLYVETVIPKVED